MNQTRRNVFVSPMPQVVNVKIRQSVDRRSSQNSSSLVVINIERGRKEILQGSKKQPGPIATRAKGSSTVVIRVHIAGQRQPRSKLVLMLNACQHSRYRCRLELELVQRGLKIPLARAELKQFLDILYAANCTGSSVDPVLLGEDERFQGSGRNGGRRGKGRAEEEVEVLGEDLNKSAADLLDALDVQYGEER